MKKLALLLLALVLLTIPARAYESDEAEPWKLREAEAEPQEAA